MTSDATTQIFLMPERIADIVLAGDALAAMTQARADAPGVLPDEAAMAVERLCAPAAATVAAQCGERLIAECSADPDDARAGIVLTLGPDWPATLGVAAGAHLLEGAVAWTVAAMAVADSSPQRSAAYAANARQGVNALTAMAAQTSASARGTSARRALHWY